MTHLLDIDDLTKTDIDSILKLATELKQSQIDGNVPSLLHGKTLSMLFEKPSTRTRVSFEVGMIPITIKWRGNTFRYYKISFTLCRCNLGKSH